MKWEEMDLLYDGDEGSAFLCQQRRPGGTVESLIDTIASSYFLRTAGSGR